MKKLFAALFVFFALIVLSRAALPVSAAIPTTPFDIPDGGLWFKFDGNAEEASGALTGTLRGSPRFVEGRDGTSEGAISFETEEQAVALKIDDIEGDWTASFWVKVSGSPYILHPLEILSDLQATANQLIHILLASDKGLDT